ncbi:MAG: chemotaxis protein CheA [Nitrospirae bacterium]|nr:chemotaxis protein CheA [Nitrospirota bacterium]
MVRDLAKKSNKNINFAMYGEDTELDSSVIEMISDPLIHLVRNAIDHGIEANPDDRVRAGKKEAAKVSLHAFHKGGNVYIQIRDDGKGLDKDIILKKAMQKGLLKEGQNLSADEIHNLIFLPGFSTKDVVTDVSGRGVGMDVVKRNIESLRGTVEIDTELGKGSTFSLRLPLTLAIIDGMLVNVGKEIYIIPTISIVESLNPKQDDIMTAFGTIEMIKVRGELIALFRLAGLFDVKDAKTDITKMLVVVVEDSGNKAAIAIDNLLGQQSTVIKSLGENFQGIPGISGGTILSNGQVGIIIDVGGIVKLAKTITAKNIKD